MSKSPLRAGQNDQRVGAPFFLIAAALCSAWPQGGARQRAVCCFIGEADEAPAVETLSSSPNRPQPQGGRFEIETTKEASMRYTYVRQHDTTDCAAA